MVNFLFHLSRFRSAWLHEKRWEDLRRKEQNKVPLICWKQLLSTLCLFYISPLYLFFMVRDMTFIYTTLSIIAYSSIVLTAAQKCIASLLCIVLKVLMEYHSLIIANFTQKPLKIQRNYSLECRREEAYKILVEVARNHKTPEYL